MSHGSAHALSLSLVDEALRRVRGSLRDFQFQRHELLRPMIRGAALDRGKLLRPSLLLLSGRLFGPIDEDHIRAATILELIHGASLLHDDVLDHGRLRRGAPTANQRWGNHTAVLLGDLVLAEALRLNAQIDSRAKPLLARMIGRTCDGEIEQDSTAGCFDITERRYLSILSRKTAALFKGACCLGAVLTGAEPAQIRAVGRFGFHAGMAYQMMDDLLDITGSAHVLRKTLGTDMQRAKPTLPLIHALGVFSDSERQTLLDKMTKRTLSASEMLMVVARTDSAAYVRARIDDCLDRAAVALHCVEATPARTALIELSESFRQLSCVSTNSQIATG